MNEQVTNRIGSIYSGEEKKFRGLIDYHNIYLKAFSICPEGCFLSAPGGRIGSIQRGTCLNVRKHALTVLFLSELPVLHVFQQNVENHL